MSAEDSEITDVGALRVVPPATGVDLWIVCLAENDLVADSFLDDKSERERSARILVPARRRLYVFRRACRQHVLRQYLSSWRIEHSPEGKPYIVGSPRPPLHFSASSSREFCAIAVSAGEVGIDIVASSSRVDLSGICAWFVLGFEVPAACPEAVKLASGRWHWARFEARLKLRGGQLFDALTHRAPDRGSAPCHEIVVATESHVCAIARSVPFRLTRLEMLPFAKVAAYAT